MELRTYLGILWRKWWVVLPAFLSTIVATAVLTFTQTPVYRTTATFVVAPKKLSFENTDSFVDGLSILSRNTEIASTYVEVAKSRKIKQEAAAGLNLSASETSSLSVDSRLLAGTVVIELTVEGKDPVLAQVFAATIGDQTTLYMQGLYEAYEFRPLDAPSLPRSPVKPNKKLNLALGAISGLALGAGLAFLAEYLQFSPDSIAARPAMAPGLKSSPMGEETPAGAEQKTSHSAEALPGVLTMRRPYIGATTERRVHHHLCSCVEQIKDVNKVFFQTLDEALAAGYAPCKRCEPARAAAVSPVSDRSNGHPGGDGSGRAKATLSTTGLREH